MRAFNPAASLGSQGRVVRVRYRGADWAATYDFEPISGPTALRPGQVAPRPELCWGAGDSFSQAVVLAWLKTPRPAAGDYIELYSPRGLIMRATRFRRGTSRYESSDWTVKVFIR